MEEEEHEINGLRNGRRRKKSSVGISCCFSGTTQHHRGASFDAAASSSSSPISHRRSTSAWLPEIKGKRLNFISRMARHRRHASADFSYDPLSYALNFDDDASSSYDEFHAMNFSARLPLSPPTNSAAAGNDELRRGFEALSVSMNRPAAGEISNVAGQRRNKSTEMSAAVAEVKRSLEAEEVTSPIGISSNQGVLVQLC
ncbi:hypothetical protein DH2020_046543 [Rehmannia glutinosa]|uniref:Uncharacterized protein n=1 Tax=Rehmannia glutinosa TaxID=99300 RepID=A0ABR0UAZ2_REHGL